jgi:hypothetical protein
LLQVQQQKLGSKPSFAYTLGRFSFYFGWQGFVGKICSSKMADEKA